MRAVDLAVDATGATPDATAFAALDEAVDDPAVLDTAAFSSGLAGAEDAAGVAAPVAGAGVGAVAPAVVAGEAGVVGVSVDAGPVGSEAGTVGAVPVGSVAGVVGPAVVGATGSDEAGAVDSALEPADDVVDDGDADNAGVVDSEPELAAEELEEVIGFVDPVDSELDAPAEVVVVDPELPPTVVAEIVDDGEVVVVELAPAAGEDVVRVAAVPSVAVLAVPVPVSVLELLLADEGDPDAASVSAWATPEPLINAAPKPTVTAEVLTHVGTS
ncbi:hypothetical protein H7J06_21445 [Mycobacterium hodleri]|uniref:hypothetical protein n=1 Tax=Mycolicibacterium hodleri TaxID=49897 RepID=UPI0021F29B1C|nr:hypothetical protein [Mycolicibacterium hodleri]MCV7135545.1 hypothetical protein [Mycolicibacterium hodleri]